VVKSVTVPGKGYAISDGDRQDDPSIIGHVFINDTSAVLMYYLTNRRMKTLGILGICIGTSPMSVSTRIMPLQMQMKRM
jgi:hypothetical protein